MATVALRTVWVWECENCPVVLQARTHENLADASSIHVRILHHQSPVHWDPPMERETRPFVA